MRVDLLEETESHPGDSRVLYHYTGTFDEVAKALRIGLTELVNDHRVVVHPFFGDPDIPYNFPDVFVLMPFSTEMDPIYEDHIKEVAKRLGLKCERADSSSRSENIVKGIWKCIFHSKVVICDCTARNPNVFYELGIAHTVGKPTVLLAQTETELPFDIRNVRTIFYDYSPRGVRDLESKLTEALTDLLAGDSRSEQHVRGDGVHGA